MKKTLAVCVLPFALILFGTLYQYGYMVHETPFIFSTDSSVLENVRIPSMKSSNKSSESPKDVTYPVFIAEVARLGNSMFAFASAMGIAHTNHRPLIVSPRLASMLREVFDMSDILHFTVGPEPHGTQQINQQGGPNGFDEANFSPLPDAPVKPMFYLQSWRYFHNVSTQIRQVFTFPGAIRAKSKLFLSGVKRTDSTITVGIHVRRGDYEARKYPLPRVAYMVKAMQYYRNMYDDIQFVLCSDSPDWCEKWLGPWNVTIHHGNIQEDLSLLVACDHMIITKGTFGWWAAWLNGGRVVYFDKPYGKERNEQMKNTFFLPSWIPMGN